MFQKMAPKTGINVRVLSLDTELEFTVLEKTTGGVTALRGHGPTMW